MLTNLTLNLANQIVANALQHAVQQYQGRALSVSVCDKQGFLLAFARMDNAKLLTIELTQCKAYTSSRLGCTTQAFLQRLQNEGLNISYFADARFTALPGGIPLFNQQQQCIGALAIGGLSASEDHAAAEYLAQQAQPEINGSGEKS